MRAAVERWVATFVVELGLCPFARREVERRSIRYAVSDATSEERLLEELADELLLLRERPEIETTLLIHPHVLGEFSAYNDFLDYGDALLVDLAMDGEFQIASFHPDYRFAGTDPDDPENYSNRSPFPLLHLLREASVERAIASYPEVEQIPLRNVNQLRELGVPRLRALLAPG